MKSRIEKFGDSWRRKKASWVDTLGDKCDSLQIEVQVVLRIN